MTKTRTKVSIVLPYASCRKVVTFCKEKLDSFVIYQKKKSQWLFYIALNCLSSGGTMNIMCKQCNGALGFSWILHKQQGCYWQLLAAAAATTTIRSRQKQKQRVLKNYKEAKWKKFSSFHLLVVNWHYAFLIILWAIQLGETASNPNNREWQ